MKYQNEIKKHLSSYKRKKLPNIPNGEWRGNEYDQILPKERKYLNLIEYYREEFQLSNLKDMKLHMYFNHLNSSQAMCINFFYPLYYEKNLNIVMDFLGFSNEHVDYDTVLFEKESEIDGIHNRRPTNFDFYFETTSGKKFFFEIKYTEAEFGQAKNDKEHIEKYNNIYKLRFKPINDKFREKDLFFQNYQIIRNLIHVDNNSYVVFLYPVKNLKIHEGANKAKDDILKKKFKNNLFIINWYSLHKHVFENNKNPKIEKQLTEFEDKYFLKSPAHNTSNTSGFFVVV